MLRLRKVKLNDDIILNFLGKGENYLQSLKAKVGDEFEEGYLLHNKKSTIYFIFPNMTLYNVNLVKLDTSKTYVNIADGKRDFLELYANTFEVNVRRRERTATIIAVKPFPIILSRLFGGNGCLHTKKCVSLSDGVYYRYLPEVYDNTLKKHISLKWTSKKADAKEQIVQWFITKTYEIISCKFLILSAKGKQYLLTEDGRVYTNTLRKLKVNKDGCVYIAGLKRNLEGLIEKFF